MMDRLINLIRREAQKAIASRQFKGMMVATEYDPKTHSVKGILVPHGIETNWIPLGAQHVGNGFGVLCGPNVGDPKKLDGDQFDVEFDFADPNTISAHHRKFSSQAQPPQVQSGEILMQHQNQSQVYFDKSNNLTVKHGPTKNTLVFNADKSITITHGPTGSMIQIDPNGNHIHDPKSGQHIFKGQATFQQNVSMSQELTVTGIAALGGGSTAGGVGIQTV